MLPAAAAVLVVGVFAYAYHSLVPPKPKVCGSPGGPSVTSPRIKLSDGRHLAYRERGVPRDRAKHKVILVHGFDSSKDLYIPLSQVNRGSDPTFNFLMSCFCASSQHRRLGKTGQDEPEFSRIMSS